MQSNFVVIFVGIVVEIVRTVGKSMIPVVGEAVFVAANVVVVGVG